MTNKLLKNQLKNQHGFTLIEIMLVLFIMGMVSVSVLMTFPNNINSENNLQWQAQRFSSLLQFAEDEALISGMDLGLFFDENSYQFTFYDYKSKKWLPIVNKPLQDKIALPDAFNITYTLAGLPWDEIDTEEQDRFIDQDDLVNIEGDERTVILKPQVYIMASAQVTPFSVEFSAEENDSDQQPISISVGMSGTVTSQ